MAKLKQHESVKHIMQSEVTTITLNDKLSTVGKIFSEGSFHHLPVLSGKELIGVISYLDLMRVSFEDSFGVTAQQQVYEVLDHTLTVESVMTKEPVTVSDTGTVKECAELLAKSSFHSLPVVNDQHELVGIVTASDLLSYLVDLY